MEAEWVTLSEPLSFIDFRSAGLAKVGTLLELEYMTYQGEKYRQYQLIGTVNQEGGQCGCCGLGTARVLRYKGAGLSNLSLLLERNVM